MSTSSPPAISAHAIRAIALLACAAFASQSMVRVTDSLLPQIASDLGVTVGAASIVVTAYAISHGSVQLFIGPIADRFGKYISIALGSGFAGLLVMMCGLAPDLTTLTVMRLVSGLAAGWIIPLAIAFVGDVVPYERRQQVLGTYLSGQILGQLFGQAAGGVLGDLIGWRRVFFVLGGLLLAASAALLLELRRNPVARSQRPAETARRGFIADYAVVLRNPWARLVILFGALEFGLLWGTYAYVGADLHLRFGLSFTAVGLVVATLGIGGLLYSLTVRRLVDRLGQRGLAIGGGLVLTAAFATLAFAPHWWMLPAATTAVGFGFYMLHNTLQTNATQMTPEARGTAVAIFSSALYLGQTVAVAGNALVFDRYGAVPVYLVAAVVMPLLGLAVARALARRARRDVAGGL